jgi:hypothetical protein
MRHGLQYGEIKTMALTVSNIRVSSVCRLGKQRSKARCAAQGSHCQRAFKKRLRFMPGKRPYGRVNVFREWRNDGKKERTA